MLKLGILCSGGLGLTVLEGLYTYQEIKFVLTDGKSVDIIKFCGQHRIPCFSGNPRNGAGYRFMNSIEVDIIASVNYLFLIEEDIIKHPKLLAFNIHGSLLPKYRGRTPHVWAIINNETTTGLTIHKIDAGCDTGEIIKQVEIPIFAEDTGADILNKFSENYLPAIKTVIEDIGKNEFTLIAQDDDNATYFGKRIPEDGEINWDWSKERIYNWVRAQAFPYPGAFSYYEGDKITIDKVTYSNVGFHYQEENGKILKLHPLTIKGCNGALELNTIREKNINFRVGGILSNSKLKKDQ